jgi:branched-chain amino acid transport system substrate-binding protein
MPRWRHSSTSYFGASNSYFTNSSSEAPENAKFIKAFEARFKTLPDQFAAQSYDAMHILAQALGKIRLSGELAADRSALREALPSVKWTGATGAFQFRRALDKAGKPAGYDAQQTAIVSVTKGGKFVIEK